ALELFGQIEAQYRARSQEDDEATALGDLAAVVSVTGDLSRALRYLDEAEQLEERTTSTDAFLRLLRALLLTHSGRIEQAAEILREVPRPPDEPVPSSSEPAAQLAAMWWRVRSQVDRRRGATGPAVAAARRAFHLAARWEPQLDPGPMLVELASSLRDAGDEECFEWFHRAIQDAHHAGRQASPAALAAGAMPDVPPSGSPMPRWPCRTRCAPPGTTARRSPSTAGSSTRCSRRSGWSSSSWWHPAAGSWRPPASTAWTAACRRCSRSDRLRARAHRLGGGRRAGARGAAGENADGGRGRSRPRAVGPLPGVAGCRARTPGAVCARGWGAGGRGPAGA